MGEPTMPSLRPTIKLETMIEVSDTSRWPMKPMRPPYLAQFRFFPNFPWNYQWDSGVPPFAGSYPPTAYYIIAAV